MFKPAEVAAIAEAMHGADAASPAAAAHGVPPAAPADAAPVARLPRLPRHAANLPHPAIKMGHGASRDSLHAKMRITPMAAADALHPKMGYK
jgi:hypothetical protein